MENRKSESHVNCLLLFTAFVALPFYGNLGEEGNKNWKTKLYIFNWMPYASISYWLLGVKDKNELK